MEKSATIISTDSLRKTNKRTKAEWTELHELVAPFNDWRSGNATRLNLNSVSAEVRLPSNPNGVGLESPEFTLKGNRIYNFRLTCTALNESPFCLVLHYSKTSARKKKNWIECRPVFGEGQHTLLISHTPNSTAKYCLSIVSYTRSRENGARLTTVKVTAKSLARCPEPGVEQQDTYLNTWGTFKRRIHDKCKNSRRFNNFVSSMEMRLGRDEVLSMPSYMAICPTGQCNALCDFCSVTIKRTGIIKKQLPFEKIRYFLAPTLNTISMYGLEGNGEPTLYREFNQLVAELGKKGAARYLITNGELIKSEQIPILLSLASITFSLNAATAETHRRVMKLKGFDKIVSNIKELVKARGMLAEPTIFVSFVVNQVNVHELQDFLRFAEYELEVDVIMIRPLSELGNDEGSIEDFRDIVPYEADIKDALDAADEYIRDVPRRGSSNGQSKCRINLEPSTFRSVRSNPVERIVMPYCFENRILPPRRSDWILGEKQLSVEWHLNTVKLTWPSKNEPLCNSGFALRSTAIPVNAESDVVFRGKTRLLSGDLCISIVNEAGDEISAVNIEKSKDLKEFSLTFNTGKNSKLAFLIKRGGGSFDCLIDFERLRTPTPSLNDTFKLPHPRRWQIDSPNVSAHWSGTRLNVRSDRNMNGCYLIKSYSNPCHPNSTISLNVDIDVLQGELIIGILSEDFQNWVAQFPFAEGKHRSETLSFNSGANQQIQLVVLANGPDDLKVVVDWKDTLEPTPSWEKPESQFSPESANANKSPGEARSLRQFGRQVGTALKTIPLVASRSPKYYCQKPWTDLNNFTVDGRLDVCCIATGPSQERFSLGNIFEQDFQKIWNGHVMKEFRRTVNSSNKLPPCKRCPMAYAYQGLFFDKNIILGKINQKLFARKTFSGKWGMALSKGGFAVLNKVFGAIFFRGFKNG